MRNSNSSGSAPSPNSTAMTAIHSGSPVVAGLSMALGLVSNIVALVILVKAYARLRRRSKASFLLFACSLVVTDFLGHVIPGTLVLRLYSAGLWPSARPADLPCQALGASMVFFGLCPLFLGCAMAAERCLGTTRPLLHTLLVSTARTKAVLALIWLLALAVSLLPFASLGEYTYQYPGTWCFIRVLGPPSQTSERAFVLLFSGLGLASLGVALVCNGVSGVWLVRARLRTKTRRHHSAKAHDIEMVVQLFGIMVTSCICWSPLLIFALLSVRRSLGPDQASYGRLMVTCVRLAIWNQVLDPWVYILLRRSVLRSIYVLATRPGATLRGSTVRRWDLGAFQSSEKNHVNKT